MSLYQRSDSKKYWFKFVFDGKEYRGSTNETTKRKAATIEAARRTQLAKGEVGIEALTPAPSLRKFSQEFIDFVGVRNADKPETVRFYSNRLSRLLEWPKLREMRLDRIDEPLIQQYVELRRAKVGIVAVNRELATLRRLLHVARDMKKIRVVPKVKLLPGEQWRGRDFILSRELEPDYLAACPQPLHDVAVLLLDTGLRLGEALALQWSDVHLEPVKGARYGWVHVATGKTKNAVRDVPLLSRVKLMLSERQKTSKSESESEWVFPGDSPDRPLLGTSLAHMHAEVRRPLVNGKRQDRFPKEFVLHSLRHTAITRWGEAGMDAFTIMKLAGHSSVTVSQKYVHPTPKTVQLAFDKLETASRRALKALSGKKRVRFLAQ